MAAVTRDAPIPISETYETLMKVSWNFDYESQVAKLDDLYNRAKENQWNAADLDWDTPSRFPAHPPNYKVERTHRKTRTRPRSCFRSQIEVNEKMEGIVVQMPGRQY